MELQVPNIPYMSLLYVLQNKTDVLMFSIFLSRPNICVVCLGFTNGITTDPVSETVFVAVRADGWSNVYRAIKSMTYSGADVVELFTNFNDIIGLVSDPSTKYVDSGHSVLRHK